MGRSEQVNLYEAKTQLSRLVDRAMAGDDVVIARAGKPMVRLVPVTAPAVRREGGGWRGRVHIADDFDELPEETAAAFRGEHP